MPWYKSSDPLNVLLYRISDDFFFGSKVTPRSWFSGCGLRLHTQTFWRVTRGADNRRERKVCWRNQICRGRVWGRIGNPGETRDNFLIYTVYWLLLICVRLRIDTSHRSEWSKRLLFVSDSGPCPEFLLRRRSDRSSTVSVPSSRSLPVLSVWGGRSSQVPSWALPGLRLNRRRTKDRVSLST